MTSFRLLLTPLIGETPFAMTSFLTVGRRTIVAHPGSAAGLSGAMLRGTIWNR